MSAQVLIIGGGVSGLRAAQLLQQKGISFRILEGGADFGGRVRTLFREETPLELGPSWFWPQENPRVTQLVNELSLPSFSQYTEGDVIIDNQGSLGRQSHRAIDPRIAYRLTEGSRSLTDALVRQLPAECLLRDHQVTHISDLKDGIEVKVKTPSGEEILRTEKVIMAMPLRLLEDSIIFSPALPEKIAHHFRETSTWMAGEAKFVALYQEPFWRKEGLSGTSFGNVGPLSETHDASHPNGRGALVGFCIPAPQQRAAMGEELVPLCLKQIARYFGPKALEPIEARVMDWSTEAMTATAKDGPLHEHPRYGLPAEATSLWQGTLRFAGTEAARGHGGYLEGALEAAEAAVDDMASCCGDER